MVAAYRRFADDLIGRGYGEVARFVRSIDPNHLLGARTGFGGTGQAWPVPMMPFDLASGAAHLDFTSPEGYALAGDLDNYLAAGGSVRTDLFSEEGTQYLTDPALVDMMLGEKLEAMAAVVRSEGWAWVDVFSDYGFAERQQHSRLERCYLPEYAEMTSARVPLENKYHELEAEHEKASDAEDWDESDKLTGQMEDIEARLAALKETLLDVNAFDKTIAGAVVTMDDGDLVVHRGLERRAARKASPNVQHPCPKRNRAVSLISRWAYSMAPL